MRKFLSPAASGVVRTKKVLGTLVFLAIFAAILLLRDGVPTKTPEEPQSGTIPAVEACTVERCVDGDTLVVQTSVGRERIRLIGCDTPETVKKGTPVERFGPEASAHTAKRIAEFGQRVTLCADGDAYDQYGRRLAIVRLGDGPVILNEELIRLGLARATTKYRFSQEMKKLFVDAENEAKSKRLGIWSGEK